MEIKLLAAILQDRTAFDAVKDHVSSRDFGPVHGALYDKAYEYYETDANATECDIDLVASKVESSMSSDDTIRQMYELVSDLKNTQVSTSNIVKLLYEKKVKDAGLALSQAILTSDEHSIPSLLDEYTQLLTKSNLDEIEDIEEYVSPDLEALVNTKYSSENTIKLAPKSLNEKFGGNVTKGHHIVLAARPEAGKTAFCVTLASAIAYQGYKVLYYANEEPIPDVIFRCVSYLTGWSTNQVKQKPNEARELAESRGFGNIVFVTAQSNTPTEISNLVSKHEIDVLITDQLRNLELGTDSQTEQLERAAKAIRKIARVQNVLAISVTQAGESAQGKAVLTISDIDNSKTGLPGACDAMIMIGYNAQLESMSRRCLTLPKNKIGGDHSSWNVVLNPTLSRYQDE